MANIPINLMGNDERIGGKVKKSCKTQTSLERLFPVSKAKPFAYVATPQTACGNNEYE